MQSFSHGRFERGVSCCLCFRLFTQATSKREPQTNAEHIITRIQARRYVSIQSRAAFGRALTDFAEHLILEVLEIQAAGSTRSDDLSGVGTEGASLEFEEFCAL